MTDFDDFDWVERPTKRERGTNDRASQRAPRSPRDPRPAARPTPNSQANRQNGHARPAGRRPRRTLWSRLGDGLRALVQGVVRLPRPLLISVGVVLFVVFLTMVLDSALFYSRVHAGVSVAGQSLGGKTYDEAFTLVTQRVDELSEQPITVVHDSESWTVTPDDVGQIIDVEASVQTAMQVTRKSNLVSDLARRLRLYFNGESLALAGEVDQEKFDAFVAQIAGELDVDPVSQSLSIQEDSIEPVEGTNGYVVDQESLSSQLMEALFAHTTTEIEVPMTTKAPDALAASTDEAIAMIQTMMSGDLTLTYLAPRPEDQTTTTTGGQQTEADPVEQTTTTTIPETTTTTVVETAVGNLTFISKTQTFSPSEIGALLDYRAEDRNGTSVLVPYISPQKLGPLFHRIEGPMTVPAVDAYFDSKNRGLTCTIVPGQEGKGLDHEATAAALTEAALQATDRVASALVKDIYPEFTTEDAEALGITEALGSWEETYEGSRDRQWNVALAAARVSSLSVEIIPGYPDNDIEKHGNLLVAPGEEFDFAATLGPRTPQAGFKGGWGIENSVLVPDIIGGGICQVSTTMFNAVMRAGLEVTERHNHSLFIDHYPEGLDATITGGGDPKNLKFINDTPDYIWIYCWSNGVKTVFTIFGTSDGRRVTLSEPERYDWRQRTTSSVTAPYEDPELETGETKVASEGQDAFKVKVIRTITWPDGTEISEPWISEWGIKPRTVVLPTSSTDTLAPDSSTTATTVP